MSDLEHRVRQVLITSLGVEADRLTTPGTRLVEDLGAGELERLELVMRIEEEFGIVVSARAEKGLTTVGDVLKLVSRG